MKNKFYTLIMVISISACNNFTKEKVVSEKADTNAADVNIQVSDTSPRVTGIGGIFFFSDNPEKTKEWYNNNLGLKTNQYGSVFEFRDANNPDQINYLQWSPFKTGNKYFAPSKREFMINYRVCNIEALVKKLMESGVIIVDSIETYDYGKFVHIMDPDGNKLELWEPVDSVLTKIGGETNK